MTVGINKMLSQEVNETLFVFGLNGNVIIFVIMLRGRPSRVGTLDFTTYVILS